jgi:putative endonuclease
VQREFAPAVYLLASQRNGTLYAGVTSNLMARIAQHREGRVRGFAAKYGVNRLVWFEQHGTMDSAILREKRIKKWNRAWKLELIEAANPGWRDLATDLWFESLD